MVRDSLTGQSRAGFTLVEALIVLVILSIAAVAASPLARPRASRAQLEAVATRMAAALRVTRAAAIAQNRELDFVVDAERHSYGSSATGVAPIDPRVEIRIAVARLERTASAGWIRFFPSGRSSGGDIYLYLDRADARVRVNWATGHAALE